MDSFKQVSIFYTSLKIVCLSSIGFLCRIVSAIHLLEDAVLLGYCAGTEEDGGCLNRLKIRRFELKEILGSTVSAH